MRVSLINFQRCYACFQGNLVFPLNASMMNCEIWYLLIKFFENLGNPDRITTSFTNEPEYTIFFVNIGQIKYNFHNFIEQNVSIMILKTDLNLLQLNFLISFIKNKKKPKIFPFFGKFSYTFEYVCLLYVYTLLINYF